MPTRNMRDNFVMRRVSRRWVDYASLPRDAEGLAPLAGLDLENTQ